MNHPSRLSPFAPAALMSVALMGALLVSLPFGGAQAKTPPPKVIDCAAMPCTATVPNAKTFEAVPGKPWLKALDADGKAIGWVVMSTELVSIKAYSGKPLVTLVGLDGEGVITGARVIHHAEPILLVGIPESVLHDFSALYANQPADTKVVVGKSSDPKAVTVDAISGATVTALALNRTILDSARKMGSELGVIAGARKRTGKFIPVDAVWTWDELIANGVMGHIKVSQKDMNGPDADESEGPFLDLYFTLADARQIGAALLGEGQYDWKIKQLKPGQHLLVVMSSGTSSFKGSGFVRGGLFDRIRVEQGLKSMMFRDIHYENLSPVEAEGAPDFKEGGVFVTDIGSLSPAVPFDFIFLGSKYSGKGGFDREFHTFKMPFQLPASVFKVDPLPELPESEAMWVQAWRNNTVGVIVLLGFIFLVVGLFIARRWLTSSMKRLQRIHIAVLLGSFLVLGVWLHAQPSVTQMLTFVGAVVGDWNGDLFLSEPLLFVFWIFISLLFIYWGRGLFCGWLCPYGALSELLYKVGKLTPFGDKIIPRPIARALDKVRYILLALLIPVYLYSPQMGEMMAEIEPFKTTFFVTPWTRHWGFFLWWLVLLAASFVTYRPFCRFICPLGGGLALFSSFRKGGPRRRQFCESCKICARGCEPEAIAPTGRINPRDCLSCMECETNYRDKAVCPPLISIESLEPGSSRRRTKVEADLKDVDW